MTFIYNNNELPLFIIKVIFHAVKVREVEKFAHIVFVYEDEWKRFIDHETFLIKCMDLSRYFLLFLLAYPPMS